MFKQSDNEIDTLDFGTYKQYEDDYTESPLNLAEKTITLKQSNFTAEANVRIYTYGAGLDINPSVIEPSDWDENGEKEVTVWASTEYAGTFVGTTTGEDKTFFIYVESAAATPEFENDSLPLKIKVTPRNRIWVETEDEDKGTATIDGGSIAYSETGEEVLNLVATPKSGYVFKNWTVDEGDNLLIDDVNDASTTVSTIIGEATITAHFEAQTCTNLAATTLNKLTKSYDYANIKWTAVANASKYLFNLTEHEGDPHITNLLTPDLETDMLNLKANTQYDYTIMAVGDGEDYCDENNPLLEGSFTTNDYPAATLTLSENGETRAWGSELKVASVIALPTAVAAGQEVAGKVLVGYTNEANKSYSHDTDAPTVFYAKGANYTIADTEDKLYAVYAIEESEGGSTTNIKYTGSSTTNMTGGNDAATFGLDDEEWSVVGDKGSNTNYPGLNKAGDIRLYYHSDGSNTLTITSPEDVDSVKISFNTGYANCNVKVGGNTVAAINGAYPIGAKTFVIGNANTSNVQVQMTNIAVIFNPNYTYSKYATTGTKGPQATVAPTSVALEATAVVGGLIDVTYDNVNTANVAVALFDDAACKTAFTGEWLNVSLDANKDIEYGAQAAVSYANTRTAYIKLTAPSTVEGVDPAVVVIPVTQAKKEAVFASLAELVASDVPAGDSVTVTLTNVPIKSFYIYKDNRAGVTFDVQKDDADIRIFKNSQTTIEGWAVNGTLSGTFRAKWSTYNDEWQLSPNSNWAWADLTYKAPSATSIDNAEAEAQVVKFIQNGQIFIEKNGVVYNVMGQEVR